VKKFFVFNKLKFIAAFLILAAFPAGCGVEGKNYPHPPEPQIGPGKLIVFYGGPNGINGADSADDPIGAAAAEFAKYDMAVLGAGIEDSGHGAHDAAVEIMNHPLTESVEFFGYIDLGVLTNNYPIEDIRTRVDQWIAAGADGIFFDDFGYDYDVTRERQNAAAAYVHSKGKNIIANAWDPDHVFGSAVDTEFNTAGTAPVINSGDYYLCESYQIAVGEFVPEIYWRGKSSKLDAYRAQYGTKIIALTTNSVAGVYSENKFHFAWYSAYIEGFDAIGWGEYLFSVDNAAPWRARPDAEFGSRFIDTIKQDGNRWYRRTDILEVWINTSTRVYGVY
jgi:hypothetical protein